MTGEAVVLVASDIRDKFEDVWRARSSTVTPDYSTALTGHCLISVLTTEVTEVPVCFDCRETAET